MKIPKTMLVFFMSVLLLTGCSDNGGNSRPSNKQILCDLQDSFLEYFQEEYTYYDPYERERSSSFDFEMIVSDFEIELSQTEDKTFTASVNAIAKATYADFYWPAEIAYTKYDQGWAIDSCSWGEYTYETVRYPSKDEIEQMISDLHITSAQKGDITHSENQIHYSIKAEANWSEYASGSATSVITWEYDDRNDDWYYDKTETEEGIFKLSKKLEGRWPVYGDEKYGGYISISNVTDTGLDVSVDSSYYQHSTTHFDLTKGDISWNNGGVLTLNFQKGNFVNTTVFEIKVYQEPSSDYFASNFQLSLVLTHVSGSRGYAVQSYH